MPPYPWLLQADTDFDAIPRRMRAMQMLGVPYSDDEVAAGIQTARDQAAKIAAKVAQQDNSLAGLEGKQVVALIAYLDRLGTDLFAPPDDSAEPPAADEPPATDEPRVSRKGLGVVFGQAAFHVVDRRPKTTPDPVAHHQAKSDTCCFAGPYPTPLVTTCLEGTTYLE